MYVIVYNVKDKDDFILKHYLIDYRYSAVWVLDIMLCKKYLTYKEAEDEIIKYNIKEGVIEKL